jgi:nucleoside-diphosphate-sugar epimerase
VRVLIAGCGYVGSALAARLAARGHAVLGLRRRPGMLPAGVVPVEADLRDAPALAALHGPFDAVVYAAAPAGRDDAAYRAVYVEGISALLGALRCGRFLLTSSTSVYGQDDGEWVDEASPTQPESFRGRRVLEGEALARSLHPHACALRLGGIYGPGRTRLLAAARSGLLATPAGPPRYTNRIHRDDAAGALAHLLGLPRLAPVYLGVDCEPAAEAELLRWLAERVGAPPPGSAGAPPGEGRGKRCSNRLLLADGYRFRFPTFREGYGALAAGDGGVS